MTIKVQQVDTTKWVPEDIQETSGSFKILPDEVLHNLFEKIPHASSLSLSETCRRFYLIENFYSKNIYEDLFKGAFPKHYLALASLKVTIGWKEEYIKQQMTLVNLKKQAIPDPTSFYTHPNPIQFFTISPSGRNLLIIEGSHVKIIDYLGNEIFSFDEKGKILTARFLERNETSIMTLFREELEDKTWCSKVHVWDLPSKKCQKEIFLEIKETADHLAEISPTGSHFYTAYKLQMFVLIALWTYQKTENKNFIGKKIEESLPICINSLDQLILTKKTYSSISQSCITTRKIKNASKEFPDFWDWPKDQPFKITTRVFQSKNYKCLSISPNGKMTLVVYPIMPQSSSDDEESYCETSSPEDKLCEFSNWDTEGEGYAKRVLGLEKLESASYSHHGDLVIALTTSGSTLILKPTDRSFEILIRIHENVILDPPGTSLIAQREKEHSLWRYPLYEMTLKK